MPLKKNKRSKKLKNPENLNKKENVTVTNIQQKEIAEKINKNESVSIENNVDDCEDLPSIPICEETTCSRQSTSAVNFNDQNSDQTVCAKSLIHFNNNNASVTKISNKNLEQSTNTNIDSFCIIEGDSLKVPKTLKSRVKNSHEVLSTSRESGEVSENLTQENVDVSTAKKAKYDLSIYDYDEDSSEELQKMNAPIKCKICTFIAETPIDLLKHKRDAHKVERKFLPSHEILKYFDYPDRTFCPICEQPIKSRNFRSTFIKHLLIHSAELTYECRICKKKFRRRDHMRSHEKRHVLSYAELKAIEDTVDNSPVQLPVILPT